MTSFLVRPAAPCDLAGVVALVPRLRAFGAPPLRPIEALDAAEQRTIEQFFDAPPEGAHLWVAVTADRGVIGAAYAHDAKDYFTGETHGHLGILAVSADVEGQGVGRALMAGVERWAAERAYRFITLNVFAGNARALGVYERAGYRPDTMRYVKELS